MFVGIIIYIGAITEEAGNRPKSMDDPAFLYWYGPSFALIFTSFVGSELTGVLAVHLYVARRRLRFTTGRRRVRPGAAAAADGDIDNGTTTAGDGSGVIDGVDPESGDCRTVRRRWIGGGLVARLIAAVLDGNESPTKTKVTATAPAVAAMTSFGDQVAALAPAGGYSGRKHRNRRRRSSATLADRHLLSPTTVAQLEKIVRRESGGLDDMDDLTAAIRGTMAVRTRPDEHRPRMQQLPTNGNSSRYNLTCNNHSRSESSSTFAFSGQQQQTLTEAARSVTSSPNFATSGSRYYATGAAPVPSGQYSPLPSIGTRSSPTANYYYYNTMRSLPPQSTSSSRDGRFVDLSSGIGLVGRAWSIDGIDRSVRRITNV